MRKQFYTPEEVAAELRVSPQTVYRWLRRGELGGVRKGRRWWVSEEDLAAFARKRGIYFRAADWALRKEEQEARGGFEAKEAREREDRGD